jgi:hypothetical protein
VVPPLHIERRIFQPSDFLSAEALGTDMPCRCKSCLKCKECQFWADSLTVKENQEYQVILYGLKFDEKRRKWTASYPFCIPPSELMDNHDQVYKYTLYQEKRLAKEGRTEEFNKQFYETVERGVFKEIGREEMKEWKGPVNYITMVEAFKEGPHSTTPLKICMNSSLRQPRPVSMALNDCLMKGPSALVDLFTVTLGIREHRYALTKDLSKFYQRVDAEPLAQHLRRVIWRGGDAAVEMKIYIMTTVNFGDKPAGCIAIAAARETAEKFGAEFPEAAWFLKYRTYVDDATPGADTMARLKGLSSEMETVARQGGFEFKETLMSGDKEKDNGEPHKVVGLIWETEEDRLKVDVKFNVGAKRAGLHLQDNVELEDEPEKALPDVITKRELWRVAQGQYDPLGLLCGYTVRFKILMRSLAEESTGRVVGWDEPVPEGTNKGFREVVKHLADLRAITFPRAAKPREAVVGKPTLMIFGDGSTLASCALAYLRWQMANGSVQCRLLAGKTRVAPKCKISIPRMELVGALLAVRLARKIIDSLRMELEAVRYFTDSSAVLGMLNKDSASFLEFVGTRVSEIRIKSDPDKEWFWIPGELNLADQGTRPTVLPKDMAPGTPYQDGLPWMRDLVETWPVKKKFTAPPAEECRKDVLNVAGGVTAKPGLVYPAWATTRAKLERIYGYVFTAVARFKRLPAFNPVDIRAKGRTKKGPWLEFGPPAEKYRTAARHFLLQDAQTGLIKKRLESLMVENKPHREEGFPERMIITVGGRQKKHLRVAYEKDELPVLPPDHELARLYLQEAHKRDHAGVDAMIMRSPSHVWITRIRPKAMAVKGACFTCKRRAKELGSQKKAPLPAHRMRPTPPFWSTAVEQFGPLSIVGTVNKRTIRKAWGVFFVCTATSLTHVEIAESYSTEAFLLALRRFMALHGAPKRFQSDQGTQLVAASRQVKAWNWSKGRQQADSVGAERHVVPTGGQHFNGQAERMIGILKKCLEGALAGKRCTLGELGTIVAEAAQMVNSRPIARSTGDPESGGPITPLHLLLGRASVEVPQMQFNETPKLTQRLQFVEDAKKQFWNKWMSQVFGGRMLSHKWTKKERDVATGDVVLLAEAENDDPTYRMGIVDSVKPREDSYVRTVSVRYTNPGKAPGERSPPKITTRPIHNIAVIVPVYYVFEDDNGPRPAGSGLPMLMQAGASAPKGNGPLPPDPACQGVKKTKPGQKDRQRRQAAQARGKVAETAAKRPEPVTAIKRGPGRPRKEAKPSADPRTARQARSQETGERPRRKAAIRAEENMRIGKGKNPEA